MNRIIFLPQLIDAKFISFDSHRFKCYVDIDDKKHNAYVPSSSSLTKYISNNLNNRYCLIYKNKKSGYNLFAIEIHNNMHIVDFKIVNKLFGDFLNSSNLVYEKYIDNYRADILDFAKETIYELKVILSIDNSVNYPDINSKRIFNQLDNLNKVNIKNKYLVFLILNKDISRINFASSFREKYNTVKENIKLVYYYCLLNDNKVVFQKVNIKSNLEEIC